MALAARTACARAGARYGSHSFALPAWAGGLAPIASGVRKLTAKRQVCKECRELSTRCRPAQRHTPAATSPDWLARPIAWFHEVDTWRRTVLALNKKHRSASRRTAD
jgi:hypothetical protein